MGAFCKLWGVSVQKSWIWTRLSILDWKFGSVFRNRSRDFLWSRPLGCEHFENFHCQAQPKTAGFSFYFFHAFRVRSCAIVSKIASDRSRSRSANSGGQLPSVVFIGIWLSLCLCLLFSFPIFHIFQIFFPMRLIFLTNTFSWRILFSFHDSLYQIIIVIFCVGVDRIDCISA